MEIDLKLEKGLDVDGISSLITKMWDGKAHVVELKKLSGLSNVIVYCKIKIEGAPYERGIVIRHLDRSTEESKTLLKILKSLSEDELGMNMWAPPKFAPKLLVIFKNGYITEYLDGETPSLEEIRKEDNLKRLGVKILHLHCRQVDPDDDECNRDNKVIIWKQLEQWIEEIPDKLSTELSLEERMMNLYWKIGKVCRDTPELGKIAFCHNDLTLDNIILTSGNYLFIDWEYSGTNYIMFELMHFLLEWAGNDLDYTKLSTQEETEVFLTSYFRTRSYISGKEFSFKDPETQNGIQKFRDLVNFFWGIWSLHRHFHSDKIEFDYLTYGLTRLQTTKI